MVFGIGALILTIVIFTYLIVITTENNKLTGDNKRLEKELMIAHRRNVILVEPLEAIAKQEPLTALKMLREQLENNK